MIIYLSIFIIPFLYYIQQIFFKKNKIILNLTIDDNKGGVRNMYLNYGNLSNNIINLFVYRKKIYIFFNLIYYLFIYNPEYIISHSKKITYILQYIKLNTKLIHVIHGNSNYCEDIEYADKIFYINDCQKKQLTKLNLIHKSHYFPNFISEKIVKINYFNKKKQVKKIGLIGRFSKEKNFETMIKCMRYIDMELYIAGEGDLYNKYLEIIKKYKLKNIHFLGWIKCEKFFELIDIFIIPSINDMFPLVILEAMRSHKAIISSKNHGSLKILENYKNCLFVNDCYNENEYIKSIELLNNNYQLINYMANNNLKKFKKNFSTKVAKKKFLNILNNF